MFTIDLLKGSGKPPRSHPLRVAAIAVAFVALAAAAALDATSFAQYQTATGIERRSSARYDQEIASLADVARTLEAAEKRRREIDASLMEVSRVLLTHAKWSGLLVALTGATPETITISDLMAGRKEQASDAQKGKYDYSLMIGVVSPSGSAAVEEFVRMLRQTLPLTPGAASIRIISQRQEEVRGRNLQYYVIECRLKP